MAVKSILSPYQRDLIRNELLKTKLRSRMPWESIAVAIEDLFADSAYWDHSKLPVQYCNVNAVEFPNYDNLRVFAIGETGEMEPVKMVAIVKWLTSDDNQYSYLSLEKLFGISVLPKAARYFADFLYEDIKHMPTISASQLENRGFLLEGKKSIFILTVHTACTKYLLPITLEETRRIHSDVKRNITEERSICNPGRIIIAPNNGLFCVLKNDGGKSNNLYIPVGIVKDMQDNEQITSLIFMNSSSAEYFDSSFSENTRLEILSSWTERNKGNCLRFNRISKTS